MLKAATPARGPTLDPHDQAVPDQAVPVGVCHLCVFWEKRLFSSMGIVKSDFRGRLLDITLIDVIWAKQAS